MTNTEEQRAKLLKELAGIARKVRGQIGVSVTLEGDKADLQSKIIEILSVDLNRLSDTLESNSKAQEKHLGKQNFASGALVVATIGLIVATVLLNQLKQPFYMCSSSE